MASLTRMCRVLLLVCAIFGMTYNSCAAEDRTPLLQEGKKSLYQRIISHPGAQLAATPGGAATTAVASFTPFYVYARQQLDGQEWLEVSPSSNGKDIRGWIKSSDASRWDKALTLMFADRMGRDPVMFFRRLDVLNTLVQSENMRVALDAVVNAHRGDDSPLVAMEPQNVSVPRNQFYLMPVFAFSDEYEQHNLRLLNVGIINPGKVPAVQEQRAPAAPPRRFSAGVAFIVDTTISMKPYIIQTKKFIHDAYDALAKSDIANDVSFAVVAYRNSTRYDARLEYVASVVSPFAPVREREAAEARIATLDEAKVSTHAFNEDAFAGIKAAIDELDWSPHAAKIAVMVTDAGAIRNDDKLSSTGMTEREMADLLGQKGIRLVVIHLQTEQGKRHNLPAVVDQYKQLTTVRDGKVKSTYIGLPVKDTEVASRQFGRIATALVTILQKIVQQNVAGAEVAKPVETTRKATPEEEAAYLGQCLGYAAYLDFAGQRRQVTAPQLENAWVADKDLDNLVQGKSTDALIPAVLLNKHQLNTLARQISILVDAARASRTADSTALFQRVMSLSAQTMRDPQQLQQGPGTNLCQMGLLPEFLEGLPYKSEVMKLTEERWRSMSAREQDELIYSLEAKLRLYQEYHNDSDNWTSFGSSDPADALYRVPLTSLP